MSQIPTTPSLSPPGLEPSPGLPVGTQTGLTPTPAPTQAAPKVTAPTTTPTLDATGQTLPTKLQAAANVAPNLSPSTTVGIASAAKTNVDSAIHAYFVNAYSQASKVADQIKAFTPQQQAKLWNAASNSAKVLLMGAGYNPPTAEALATPQTGIWHDITSVGDIAKHDLYKAGDVLLQDNPVTLAWNAGAGAVSHIIRAANYSAQQGDIAAGQAGQQPMFSTEAWSHLLNPHDLIDAWSATNNGATTYSPEALLYVQKEMGVTGQALQLAKMAASGQNLQQVLASVSKNDRANAYALIESTPKFQEAVSLLADSHLSFGQSVFGGLSAPQMQQLFPRLSAGPLEGIAAMAQGTAAAGTAYTALKNPEGAVSEVADAAQGAGTLAKIGRGLSAVRRSSLLGASALQVGGSTLGATEGKSADAATTISPFGIQVHPLSGVADGIVSWYLNPVQVGLGARAAIRGAQGEAVARALANPDEAEALYANSATYNRWAVRTVKALTSPWSKGATDAVPAVDEAGLAAEPNFGALRQAGVPTDGLEELIKQHYGDMAAAAKTGDPQLIGASVGRMLGDGASMENLMRGRMTFYYHDTTPFPRVTLGDHIIEQVRGAGLSSWGGTKFNMAKMSPLQALSQMVGERQAAEMALTDTSATVAHEGRMARFMRRAVSLTNIGPIDIADPKAPTMLERLLSYSLDPNRVADILSYYENTDPALQGQRMAIVYGGILEMIRAAIDHGDPAASQWLSDMESRYSFGSPGGAGYVNPLNPDGPRLDMAIIEPQLSTKIAAPSFTDLYRFAKKSWLMRSLNMTANNDFIDAAMSKFWKPALLLRYGFGLRVAGEEMALFILREGFTPWLRARAAGSLTDAASTSAAEKAAKAELEARAAAGDAQAQNTLDAQRVFSTLTSHIPPAAKASIKTPKQLIASVYGWHTVQWLQRVTEGAAANGADAARAVAQGVAGQDLLDTANFLNDHGNILESAFADHISAVSQHRDPYMGESLNFRSGSAWTDQHGLPLQLVRDGTYKVRQSDDPKFYDFYHQKLGELTDSSWTRTAARAFRRGGYNAQLQAVEDELRARRLWNELAVAVEQGDTPAIRRLQGKLDQHENMLRRFPVYGQTQDGFLTQQEGPLVDQMFHDWARNIVDNVNHHTMTLAVQEEPGKVMALPAAGEDGAASNLNPRPIIMPNTQAPMSPYKVEAATRGGNEYLISETFPDSAYSRIPKDHVRLFTPVNTTDTGGYNPVDNPGRFWTVSYQHAQDIAGPEGKVHQVDVPRGLLTNDFKFVGNDSAAFIDRAYAGQHPAAGRPYVPPTDAHFESGKIAYSTDTANNPETLLDMVGRGMVPDTSMLRRLPEEVLPDEIHSPDMMMKSSDPGVWQKAVSKGFYNLVGRPLDWLSRQPMFLWNYHLALRDARAYIAARDIEDESGNLAHSIAMERAVTETARYIHDPSARSQFSMITRNLAPFWFAQEQFYKRWGRLFGQYPEAWYKMSMTLHALQSVGFVYKDQYGNDAFTYPGSAMLTGLLTRLPIFQNLPINVGFSTEVNQLNPSMSNGLLPIPSFGPMAVIPVDVAGWMYPKYFGGLSQFFQGPNAAPINVTDGRAQRLLDQVMPTVLARAMEFATTDATASTTSDAGSALFLSSMIDAARLLEAGGHGPTTAQQNDPYQMQQFQTRIMHWTENMMLLRTIFGFVSPGTPNFDFNHDPNGLGNQLFALMATMPYDQAVSAFVKAHPDATAYDIFGTTTSNNGQSGAYVPATAQAGEWLKANDSFVKAYPQLAPWAMPQETASAIFSSPTYQQELNLGLRERRSLQSWVQDYYYSKGANTYYGLEQWFWAAGGAPSAADATTAQTALGVTQAEALSHLGLTDGSSSAVKQTWDKWKAGFLQANPLFASTYQDRGTTSLERRTGVVNALTNAISTGNLPKSEWSTHVEELMTAFLQVQQFYSQTQGNSGYSAERTQYKDAIIVYGTQLAKMYPDIAPLWNGVIMKQIGVVG